MLIIQTSADPAVLCLRVDLEKVYALLFGFVGHHSVARSYLLRAVGGAGGLHNNLCFVTVIFHQDTFLVTDRAGDLVPTDQL